METDHFSQHFHSCLFGITKATSVCNPFFCVNGEERAKFVLSVFSFQAICSCSRSPNKCHQHQFSPQMSQRNFLEVAFQAIKTTNLVFFARMHRFRSDHKPYILFCSQMNINWIHFQCFKYKSIKLYILSNRGDIPKRSRGYNFHQSNFRIAFILQHIIKFS